MDQNRRGSLLVASSLVTDPIFARGVCLVVHQDENLAIGVMLNRPLRPAGQGTLAIAGNELGSGTSFSGRALPSPRQEHPEAVDQQPASAEPTPTAETPLGMLLALIPGHDQVSPSREVHFGGPLSSPLVAIHQESQLAEAAAGTGIYVAIQKQNLESLLKQDNVPYRLIVGHLGWKSDQLEQEIDAGIWHVIPATVESVFGRTDDMWHSLIGRATSNSLARWIGIPDHPSAHQLN
jgi:putative transcriptional regulator